MPEANNHAPGITTLLGRLASTGVGAVQNRLELLGAEWQEERVRLTELLFWTVGMLFLGIMGALLLTATIIFLFPSDSRIYVAGGFAALYFIGAVVAWVGIRSRLRREPFTGSIEETRKDRVWLESLK